MTTLQVVSFILLWMVIIAEGVLLVLLYRHVGLLYTRHADDRLAVGTSAPSLIVQATSGATPSLLDLLQADITLFVFGSSSCTGCRTLLADQTVRTVLTERSVTAYFLLRQSEQATSTGESVADMPLIMLTVADGSFEKFHVTSVPFAYAVTRTGTIAASGTVSDGARSLREICDSARRYYLEVSQKPIPVISVQQAGR